MNYLSCNLSELASIYSGFAFKSKDLVEKGIPVIKIANIQNKKVTKECASHLPEDLFIHKLAKYLLRKEDVLIAMTGAGSVGKVGKMRKVDRSYLVNQRVAIVRPDSSKCIPEFIYQVLSLDYYEKSLYSLGLGAGQPNVSSKMIGSLKVPYPDLDTQAKIASILSAYDDLIENNTRRIKILEEMAQTIYNEWFVKFRFPGHENVKMVESELGMIPEGWETKTLEEICTTVTDGSHWSPKSVDEGLLMASVKDMHNWGFDTSKCRIISKDDYDKLVSNNCRPLKNDILVAKDGSYLKHLFVVEYDLNLVILSSIAILRPRTDICPHFLAMYLKNDSVKARMRGYVSGVAIPRIILKDFRKFKVLFPLQELQDEWCHLVVPMIHECWRLIDKNNNLNTTRDLLLPRLISGEIDVSELDIDVGGITA
jgi:type I restriction enzyme S subunit